MGKRFSSSFPSRPTTTTSRMALSASRGVMRGLVARGRQFCTSRSSKAVIDAEARKANFDRSAVHPVYFKLKEKQAAMKGVMNVPVHLKGGSRTRFCSTSPLLWPSTALPTLSQRSTPCHTHPRRNKERELSRQNLFQ